jgi:A/G-specific adenine glycosylase
MTPLQPLIKWYLTHKRDLPWRDTHNPYYIWLSEIILQQTRVEQGLPYYIKFITNYPTVQNLAQANDNDVMKLWQGLGYYNRAANMLKTARILAQDYNGEFPKTYNQLIELKGIGPYTAAAIASFAFNEAHAVVDGNVYRVLSRLFAIDEPINGTKGKKIFAELAQDLLNTDAPATHNHAIMELGAVVCKPKQALCGQCVLRLQCEAYKQNKVYDFPVKEKKRKPVARYLNYLYITDDKGNTYLRQRNNDGIWNNLFEFPLVESETEINAEDLLHHPKTEALLNKLPDELVPMFSTKHQLTHQTLYAVFWKVSGKQIKPAANKGFVQVSANDIQTFAVPRLLERFLDTILP